MLDGAHPDLRSLMNRALGLQLKGDLAGADLLYRDVLKIKEDEPDTLHMLGVICYQSHRHAEALELIYRAIELTGGRIEAMYNNLGLALSAALTDSHSGQAAKIRLAYAAWKSSLSTNMTHSSPLITIVVLGQGNASELLVSLKSVYAQSYRFLEVIVVTDGDGQDILPMLAACPFQNKIVLADDQALSASLNQGVKQAGGEFIGVLMTGDCYDPQRIEKMLDGIVYQGGEWGFSACIDKLSGKSAAIFETVRGRDTTGFSLLSTTNIVTSASNLFFSRKLFDIVGGFESSSSLLEECFALRAVLEAEPFFVEEALCHCAIDQSGKPQPDASIQSGYATEAVQRYYEQSVEFLSPSNPFAPVLSVWQTRFICQIAALNHLKYMPMALLQSFVVQGIAAQISLASSSLEKQPGLDLVSFFSGEMGLAESARGIAQSCHVGRIPFSLRSFDLQLSQRCGDRSMDPWLSDHCSHAAIVLMFNPDALKLALPQLGQNEMRNRYCIGYWYWETEQLPAEWLYALDLVDEVWVATEFVAEAVRKFTSKPVTKIHPPIDVQLSRQYARHEFGLKEGRFLFLFSFDFGSFSSRKNPYATILAFQKAFPLERQDVGLVIKSHGGGNHPEKLLDLQNQIQCDPRITLIDRMMSRDQVFGLQSVCDVFVSLHRSEGLGLGLAESMAQGKAVIGTAYSGNLEFMTKDNSCLVDFDMIPIEPGQYLYDQSGVSWADPSIEQAAWYMEKLLDDKAYYQRISTVGQQDILLQWNHVGTANAIRRRLSDLGLMGE